MRWSSHTLWRRVRSSLANFAPFARLGQRLRRCCLVVGCGFSLVVLVLTLLIILLVLTVDRAFGQAPPGDAVVLLIDNSNSMYDLRGIGSDPDLLRIEAARLFVASLGVDADEADHWLGVIFFGGDAQAVVPLTPLRDDTRRGEIAELIARPERMRWTDPNEALELAHTMLFDDSALTAHRPVVILLTDGKPQWSGQPAEDEVSAYVARTRELTARFRERGAAIFVVLLANEATEGDPEITQRYRPLWQEIASATPPGRFYELRSADDLISVYHAIVVALSGARTDGAVVEAQATGDTLRWPVAVEAGLARVAFVVYKSEPDLAVGILRPDGRRVNPTDPRVRLAGQGRHQVWAVDAPEAGLWTVLINGRGRVTVWKDYWPVTSAPSPMPAATLASRHTPALGLEVTGLPEAVWANQVVTVTARLTDAPAGVIVAADVRAPDGGERTVYLLHDEQLTNGASGGGCYTARFAPHAPGSHLLRLAVLHADTPLAAWEGRVEVINKPALRLTTPSERATYRLGRPISVVARWHPEGPTTTAASVRIEGPTVATAILSAEGPEMRGLVTGLRTAGTYTLTVFAEGRMDPGLSVAAQVATPVHLRAPIAWWAWVLAGLTIAGAGGACGWLIHLRGRPCVEGTLERLDAPTGARQIDLGRLRRRVVHLGPGAAGDVPVEGEAAGSVRPRARGDGELDMILSMNAGDAVVNGRPLLGEHVLQDGDVVTVGNNTRFRYHNLRQHSADAWWTRQQARSA